MEDNDTKVHLAHCNKGEYKGSCKYGDKDCPTMIPSIDIVYLNPTRKEYLVIGTELPPQIRRFDEFDEWDTVNNYKDEPLFDVQVWFDDSVKQDDEKLYYGFQYVNLVPNKLCDGYLIQGDNWSNPDKLIITDKTMGEILLELNNAENVW